MLNQDSEEILFDDQGKVTGIKCGDQSAYAPLIICDPSYAPDKMLKPSNQIVRAICILNHPIPETNDASSVQIIIPAKQLERNNGKYSVDKYIFKLIFG